jgi:hypothetical protein
MVVLQLVCLAIVASYVVARLVLAEDASARKAFVLRFAALAIAAAIGEDTVIRAYGAYSYSPEWTVFVGRVPLVVVLVWPVVIDSAASVARCALAGATDDARRSPDARIRWGLVGGGWWRSSVPVASLTALIVFADASLIEPIAVRARLWAWTDPGVFDVPLIGIAGWAFFAGAATAVLGDGRAVARALLLIPIAPLVTHALILGSWWGLFRWIHRPIAPSWAVTAAWVLLLPATLLASRAGRRIPLSEILLRAPGAAFFFTLLALGDVESAAGRKLLFYALAFAPPYLVAMASRLFGSKDAPMSMGRHVSG